MTKFKIVYGEDWIQIKRNNKEVLYWIQDEWVENPQVAFSIFNAIELASKNKLDSILKTLCKDNAKGKKL
jgi:hypothetical protein